VGKVLENILTGIHPQNTLELVVYLVLLGFVAREIRMGVESWTSKKVSVKENLGAKIIHKVEKDYAKKAELDSFGSRLGTVELATTKHEATLLKSRIHEVEIKKDVEIIQRDLVDFKNLIDGSLSQYTEVMQQQRLAFQEMSSKLDKEGK
jgi:hypothetical protein